MKKRYKIGIGVILFLGLFVFLDSFQAYRDVAFICENTGSHKGYREWRFGLQTNQWYKKSPLEDFIQNNHPDILEHRWTSYMGTGRNISGSKMLMGHGRPGAIYQIPHELLEEWIEISEPEEVLELYQLLASDRAEELKKQRIQEIVYDAIDHLENQ